MERVRSAPPSAPRAAPEGFEIRELDPRDLTDFAGAPGIHYLCFGSTAYSAGRHAPPGEDRKPVMAFATVSLAGEIVAAATISRLPGGDESGELTVAARATYQRFGVVEPLLDTIAAAAAARSFRHLTTCVPCERADPFALFAGSRLRTVSWLNIGGVTEAVLAID